MRYICNAFSIQMINDTCDIHFEKLAEKPNLEGFTSAVGHADTAAVLGVTMNRISVKLNPGDDLVVAQLVGGRLPEGSTTLPEGFYFEFWRVTVR